MQHIREKEAVPCEHFDLRTLGTRQSTAILPALQFQHQFFLHTMKGALLPAALALQGNEVLLDFPSGSGSWCSDVSRRYPRAQVWGIETDQALVDLAVENAIHDCSENLHFHGIENPCVLPFADATFEVIHLQQSTSLVPCRQWPRLLAEMARLLKPGGWLHLVDFEMGFASGAAVDRLLTYLGQMLTTLGWGSVSGETLPVTGSVLGPGWMAQLGFTEIDYSFFPVDLGGWNNQVGRTYIAQCVIRPELIAALATRTGISTPEEIRQLLWEAQRELRRMSFCGVGILLSSSGRKPWQNRSKTDRHSVIACSSASGTGNRGHSCSCQCGERFP